MLLNLDAEDGKEDYVFPDEDTGGLTKKEAVFRDALTKKYKNCGRCGTEVSCKVNRHGLHSHLTFNQINAWAIALVCRHPYLMEHLHSPLASQASESSDVSLDRPPKTELFMDFFATDISTSLPSTSSAATSAPSPTTLNQNFHPYGDTIFPTQYNPIPIPFPSYEQPFTLDPMYQSTTIDDFLREIEERDPRRQLTGYASCFQDLGYLDLSEIFWMDMQTLQASTGMPDGIAYLVRRELDERREK